MSSPVGVEITDTLAPSAELAVDVAPAPTAQVAVAAPQVVAAEVSPAGERGPAGPQGAPGNVGVVVEAAVDLNALTIVKVMASNRARPASSLIMGDGEGATGITTTAALAGEPVTIRTVGAIATTADLPVGPMFLGEHGELATSPDTGLFQLRVGQAATPRLLIVRFDLPVYRA